MPTPPSSTSTVDLTTSGNAGTVNDAVFSAEQINAGTGAFPAFLSLVHSGTEQAYNSDFRPVQSGFHATNAAGHNHSLLLANIPIVEGDGTGGTIEGVLYREFLLDANEGNGGDNNLISLDELQIWQEEAGNLTGFTSGAGFAGTHTNYLAYDLDADGDAWIAIDANLSSGSGTSDVRVLIPNILFDPNAPFVYLYSAFGLTGGSWISNNGNEEWAVRNGGSGPGGGTKASLNISKAATVPGGTADTVGEDISYSITVANTGNVNLTGVVVADPFVSSLLRIADQVGNNDNILNVGEIWAYTAHHTVAQEDIDSSGNTGITNTATAGSNETGLGPLQLDSASAFIAVDARPHVTLVKEGVVLDGTADAAGDVIHYDITIANDGNTTLNNPLVTDSTINIVTPVLDQNAPIVDPNVQLFTPVTDGDGNLGDTDNDGIDEPTDHNGVKDPGETWQYVYPGDLNSDGRHDPGETWVALNLGDTNNNGTRQVGETFVGDTNNNGVEDNGETWQFKNLGDTNNNNLQDPGETWQYSNAGDDNRNGVQDPGETFQYANVGDTNQNGSEDPGETFQFYNAGDTDKDGEEDPGETFQFTVNNSPDPVSTTNPPFNDGDDNQDGKLSVGETWSYQHEYILTQRDIDNRVDGIPTVFPGLTRDNTASVLTNEGATSDDTVSIPIVQNPDLAVQKTVTDVGGDGATGHVNAAGDLISYSVTVANVGNMTLTGITVSDPLVANLAYASGDANSDEELDVGETWTYTGTYAATQADIDNGGTVLPGLAINNTATADSDQTGPESASASVLVDQLPDLAISKAADVASVDAAGDTINYTVTVDNVGNMTLTGITVTDPLVTNFAYASGDANDDGKLDLSEIWTYSGSHVVTQAEMDAGGTIDNTATADSAQTAPEDASASVTVEQNASITLLKAALGYRDLNENNVADVGDEIVYSFTETNTGNVTLTDIGVTDTLGDVIVTGTTIASLAPGLFDDTSWSAIHTITSDDVTNGYFDNTATVISNEASASSGTVHTVLAGLTEWMM